MISEDILVGLKESTVQLVDEHKTQEEPFTLEIIRFSSTLNLND